MVTTTPGLGELRRLFAWEPDARPWHVNDHALVRGADGTWRFWGIVWPDPGHGDLETIALGEATAPHWTGPWTPRESSVRLDPERGETVLWAPHVVRLDDGYAMALATGGADLSSWGITILRSTDLEHWVRDPAPLFSDGFQARDPMLLWIPEESAWAVYYTATEAPEGGRHVVAARLSRDGLRTAEERRLVYVDDHAGTEYGPTESPFVVRHRDRYLLFLGPRPYDEPSDAQPNWEHPGYDGTDVIAGSAWDAFAGAAVAHLPLHAPEIVETPDGLVITHGGIRRGGLWAASLDLDALLGGSP